MEKNSSKKFNITNLIVFIAVVSGMFFFGSQRKELFGNGLFYLWEDNISNYISLVMVFLGISIVSSKIKDKNIGVVLFTISYIPFVLLTHIFITIILFKMGIEFFFLGLIFMFFWSILTTLLISKFFPDNLVSSIMGNIIYVFLILVVFFGIYPQGAYFATAMIEKYPFNASAEIIKKEKGSNRNFIITYRFTSEAGNDLECINNESIFDDDIKSLKIGDKVWIQYSKKYPEYCIFQKKNNTVQ